MRRYAASVFAAAAMLVTLAACSGTTGSGCGQRLQQYSTPQLFDPLAGSVDVPDSTRHLVVVFNSNQQFVGSLSLRSSSGASVSIGKITFVGAQSGQYLWHVPIGPLSAATTYSLSWTVTYPGPCLGAPITNTQVVGAFTTR